MRFFYIALFFVLLLGVSYPVFADSSDTFEYIPGEVIVKMKTDSGDTFSTIADTNVKQRVLEVKKIDETEKDRTVVVKLDKKDVMKAVEEYNKDPGVIYAEPNYLARIAIVPNDASYSSQYHHSNIKSEETWNITIGNSSVIIAVIDTGVEWNHSDLSANIWNNTAENCTNGVDDDSNNYTDDCRGFDFVNSSGSISSSDCASDEDCGPPDNDPMDKHGHGTHISGLAAAVTNNSIAVSGVCWNCKIMPVRAGFKNLSGNGLLATSDIAVAIKYAANNGAKVISMSFTLGLDSSVVRDAIQYAYSRGVVLVAAAGNSNSNSLSYPAAYDEVIAVGSTDSSDVKSSFSNHGSWLDVSAPGSSILSTYINNNTATLSGTSMSAPIIAGVVGLILSRKNFTQEEVKTIIRSSVDNLSSSNYIGTGRINALKALQINTTLIVNLKPELDNLTVSNLLKINGTVNGTNLTLFNLSYGAGIYPTNFVIINSSNSSISNNTLSLWETTTVNDGIYTIRLGAQNIINGVNQTFFDIALVVVDNIPRLNITNPANNSNITESTVFVNVSITDTPYACKLEYDSVNFTMNVSGTTCYRNHSVTSGIHNFKVWANDSTNKTGESVNVTINVDSIAPRLSLVSPTNNSVFGIVNVSLNYSAVDSNLQSCKYILDSGNETLIANCTNTTLVNLSEGIHNFTIFANDSLNNTNSSFIQFKIDLSNPLLTLTFPVNNTNYSTKNLSLNFSAVDLSLYACKYSLDGANYTDIANCTNTTLVNLSEGLHNLSLFVNDTLNRTNTSFVEFRIDSIFPFLNFTNPINNTIYSTNNLTINYSSSDLNLHTCRYELNTNITQIANCTNVSLVNLSEGSYNLTLYVNDTTNNTNFSKITFGVDLSALNISLSLFPTNLLLGENLTIYANISDYLSLSNISAIWINISNTTLNVNVTNSTYMNISVQFNTTNLNISNHAVYVFSNDSFNHISNRSSDFQISSPKNLSINVLDYLGNQTNTSIFLFYTGTRTQRETKPNTSTVSLIVPSDLWDLESVATKFNVTLSKINLTLSNISGNLNLDDPAESVLTATTVFSTARTVVELIALNSSINFSSATIKASYSSSGINENYTGVFACHTWNLVSRTCTGSWTNVTSDSTIDKQNKTFTINTSSFSAFTLTESMYCGDSSCNAGETCSSCSTDCGACASTSSSSGGGGGGGGGGTIVSTKTSFSFEKIGGGSIVKLTNLNNKIQGSGLKEIQITAKENITTLNINLEKINSNPVFYKPIGTAYKYASVNSSIDSSKFSSIKFILDVEKSWISDNTIDKNKIYLERYEAEKWVRYNSINVSENSSYITYESNVPGFSYFSITGDKEVKECESGKRCNGNTIEECANNKWTVNKVCDTECDNNTLQCKVLEDKNETASITAEVTNVCEENQTQCKLSSVEKCINNDWTEIEKCAYGCENSTCIPTPIKEEAPSKTNLTTILLVVIIAGLAILVIYKLLSSRHKEHKPHKSEHHKHKRRSLRTI